MADEGGAELTEPLLAPSEVEVPGAPVAEGAEAPDTDNGVAKVIRATSSSPGRRSLRQEERMRLLWTSAEGNREQTAVRASVDVRHSFEFPGWGGTLQEMDFTGMDTSSSYEAFVTDQKARERTVELGALPATAICGCDLMASVLYTTGLVVSKSGKLAPVCMLCVVFVLYLFRWIYAEAVTSLPLNGGSYNVLLNATTKSAAAMCACLSILSYLATGVVSAISAISYLRTVWEGLDVVWAAIGLLFIFAVLVFLGMTESAGVASGIFLLHMMVLTLLLLLGLPFALSPHSREQFAQNMKAPFPDVSIVNSMQAGSFTTALFYGYSAAMLGVTGFETSSNFVEEQAPGVFPLTLRNMWLAVSIYNPLLVLLALFCFSVPYMAEHQASLTARMAQEVGDWLGPVSVGGQRTWGDVLRHVVAIDAFVVLSGSVLTAYVGMGGLIKRLALDRCFPASVLARNKWRGTYHVVIFGFCAVSMSLILILEGNVERLAGVYTMAFLAVMAFFALGTLLLKFKRQDLRRSIVCPWWMAILGLVFVFVAFIGNVMTNVDTVPFFILYYTLIITLAFAMFQRVRVLKFLVTSFRCPRDDSWSSRFVRWVVQLIKSIQEEPFVFLAKTADPSVMNKALLYVRDNEQTSRVLVVHFFDDSDSEDPGQMRAEFESSVSILDKIYPKVMVNCLLIKGRFNPEGVDRLSFETGIAKNRMFLACPNLIHNFHEFGGVRIITH